MDVIFESQRGRPFSIEVGFFDTVYEIKEKIHKYQGIPISRQTLIFNNQVLQDDRDVDSCVILHNSHIFLVISPPEPDQKPLTPTITTAAAATVIIENQSPQLSQSPSPLPSTSPSPPPPPPPQTFSSSSDKIQLLIKTPPTTTSSSKQHVIIEMDPNETIERLKEKIHVDMESGVPINRLVLQARNNGCTELQDHRSLRESELSNGSEIDVVIIKPPPSTAGVSAAAISNTSSGSKKLKVMVLVPALVNGTKKKIPVEMNGSDNVGELRKELQKLHQRFLPQDEYFFIYKQNVMDDDRSFRWHQVAQGDTIEIFMGSITGGS